MAVQEQTPYIEYTANGITTSFALEFDCDNQDHLIVLVDDVEPVVGAWSFSNGAVVFNAAPENGKKITIQRNTPFSRTTDYQSYNNSFRPPSVNKDFDWIWWKLQELGVADWILSNRIDALKNYVDDRDDELRAYLMEEIRKQGVALDQLDEYYNYLMQRLAQIAVDKGWDASFVVYGNSTQKKFNDDVLLSANNAKQTVIYAAEYGLSETEDNTPAYNQIIADAPPGSKILFPYGKTLLGHFISENKALKLDLNGSTLTNTVNDKPIIQIGSLTVDEYTVTEAVLNHGATQFTVTNASTLFNVGDIGYLWDGATRSTTGNVNYETVKIKSISGNVITVENFIASYKGASTIRFYHSPDQLKGVELKNAVFKPIPTHTANTTLITNCENIRTDNIETEGTTGSSIQIRYCYDVISTDTRPLKAAAVGSGQGYGYQLFGVSKFTVQGVKGSGMRHVYDQDSCYFGIIRDISDDDDKSAPVTLAHNGFAGYILCENIQVTTSQYPVVLSAQGYDGTVPALKQNHPFRSVHVKNVVARIRADVDPSTDTSVYGVYFQNSVVGCSVDNVDIEVLHPNAMTSTSGSSLVRVNGVVNKGLVLSNLKANKIGRVFFGTGGTRSGFVNDGSKTTLKDISVGDCSQIYLAQGHYFMAVDSATITGTPKSGNIGAMQVVGADAPLGAYHNVENISYDGTGVAQLDCNATSAIQGGISNGFKTAGLTLAVTDGKTITINELQERAASVRLIHTAGTGSITITLPKPQTINDELRISNPASRPSVILSGTNMNSVVTIAADEIVTLRVAGSKWSIVSRSSNI